MTLFKANLSSRKSLEGHMVKLQGPHLVSMSLLMPCLWSVRGCLPHSTAWSRP